MSVSDNDLNAAKQSFVDDTAIMHQVVTGDENTAVAIPGGGSIDSIRKLQKAIVGDYAELATTVAGVAENNSGSNTGDETAASIQSKLIAADVHFVDTDALDTALTSKEDTSNKATDFSVINDTKFPTTKAVKNLLDSKLAGVLNDRGSIDASTGLYPSTNGSGVGGAIMKGDLYYINVPGTIGGIAFNKGDSIRALTDNPGTTAANWDAMESNIGYTPYNASNPAGYTANSTDAFLLDRANHTGTQGADTVTDSATRVMITPAQKAEIEHTNRASLDLVSGTNTGDETQAGILGKLGATAVTGSNTGDETGGTIKTKLGVTTLSGSNTGDETQATILTKVGATALTGSNTGDETTASIKTKLGITTLSGVNTGDQTLTSLGAEAVANKVVDFSSPSDVTYPSTLAVKTQIDSRLAGVLNDRGSWSAAANTYPNTNGSGAAGAIKKGDFYYISVAGKLNGVDVNIGDSVRALADAPGQTAANWDVLESNIGYVPENVASKDAASGYGGLTASYQLKMKNIAGTITSLFSNTNTTARQYDLPNKSGTVALLDDIPGAGGPSLKGYQVATRGGTVPKATNTILAGSALPDGMKTTVTEAFPSLPAYAPWMAVAFGNGVHVAVSGNPAARSAAAAVSSDGGVTWIPSTLPAVDTWGSIVFNGTVFCAVTTVANAGSGSNNLAAISTDGINWTLVSLPGSSNFSSALVVGTRIVVTYTDITVHSADNGATWQVLNSSLPQSNTWLRAVYGNGIWLTAATTGAGIIATSADNGATWVQRSLPNGSFVINKVAFGNGKFLVFATATALGGVVWSSADGINWTMTTLPLTGNVGAAVWNGSLWLVSINFVIGTQYMTSADGVTWTVRNLPLAMAFVNAVWTGSTFAAIGYATSQSKTIVLLSSDGINWTVGTMAASTAAATDITWNGSVYCLVTSPNSTTSIATSPDGITWSLVTLPTSAAFNSIVWTGTVFLATFGTTYFTSPDGVTWTVKQMPATFSFTAVSYGNNTLMVLDTTTSKNVITSTDNGATWVNRLGDLGISSTWTAIAWNGTKYCAVGGNSAATSTDGVTWTLRPMPISASGSSYSWASITWNGTVFCAVAGGTSNVVATSADGLTWTAYTMPSSTTWVAVSANPTSGLLVAVASNGTSAAYSSNNGQTWTAATLPASAAWASIAWNGTVFCAVANTTVAATSTDGITWTARVMPVSAIWTSIIWNGATFCAVGANSGIPSFATSADGITWAFTTYGSSTAGTLNNLAWNGKLFVVLSSQASGASVVLTSPDGLHWTRRLQSSGIGTYNYSVIIGVGTNLLALATGSAFCATSADGINWTRRTANLTGAVGASPTRGVMFSASSSDTMLVTTDGLKWTTAQTASTLLYTGVAWTGSKFLATTGNGAAANSADGATWYTPRLLNSSSANTNIAYNGSVYVQVSGTGGATAYFSADGLSWSPALLPQSAIWVGLTWNGTVFVMFAQGASVCATSPDGVVWTYRTLPSSATWTACAWNGSLFCLVASTGSNVMTSPDGITWTSRAAQSGSWASIAWNGSTFLVIAASGTSSMTSANGTTGWTIRTLPAATTWNNVVSNGTLFLIILRNTTSAYTSPDGVTWTLRTLPNQQQWITVAWNGSAFCIFGVSGGPTNNYLTSPDGITWTQRSLGISGSNVSAYVFGASGKFFATGTNGSTADSWVSSDNGATWLSTYSNPTFTGASFPVGAGGTMAILTPTQMLSSTDGSVWTTGVAATGMSSISLPIAAAYGNGKMVVMFGGLTAAAVNRMHMYSANLTDWFMGGGMISTVGSFQVAWNGSIYVAAFKSGSSSQLTGFVLSSPDGVTWTQRKMPIMSNWGTIAWNGTIFCVIGNGNSVCATSPDGINWTSRVMPSDAWNTITSDGVGFLATSTSTTNGFAYSVDCITWKVSNLPQGGSNVSYANVAYSSTLGMFVFLSQNGIFTSTNGTTWKQINTGVDAGVAVNNTGVVWTGSMFAVLIDKYVITSTDGVTWRNTAPLPSNYPASYQGSGWSHISVLNGSIALMSPLSALVLTSADGNVWTERSISKPGAFVYASAANDKMFAIAQYGAGTVIMKAEIDNTSYQVPLKADAGVAAVLAYAA